MLSTQNKCLLGLVWLMERKFSLNRESYTILFTPEEVQVTNTGQSSSINVSKYTFEMLLPVNASWLKSCYPSSNMSTLSSKSSDSICFFTPGAAVQIRLVWALQGRDSDLKRRGSRGGA